MEKKKKFDFVELQNLGFLYFLFKYTPSSMKIGELSHRIFSFIKAKFSSIAIATV